jgi:hypothetical protein
VRRQAAVNPALGQQSGRQVTRIDHHIAQRDVIGCQPTGFGCIDGGGEQLQLRLSIGVPKGCFEPGSSSRVLPDVGSRGGRGLKLASRVPESEGMQELEAEVLAPFVTSFFGYGRTS